MSLSTECQAGGLRAPPVPGDTNGVRRGSCSRKEQRTCPKLSTEGLWRRRQPQQRWWQLSGQQSMKTCVEVTIIRERAHSSLSNFLCRCGCVTKGVSSITAGPDLRCSTKERRFPESRIARQLPSSAITAKKRCSEGLEPTNRPGLEVTMRHFIRGRPATRLLVLCIWFVFASIEVGADVDRILQQFNIVVDKLASDPGRAIIYKSIVSASRPCIEPISTRVGDEEVERLIESIVPMAERCIAEYGDSTDIEYKRSVFRECSQQELANFARPLSITDRQHFLEVKLCVKDMLVPT